MREREREREREPWTGYGSGVVQSGKECVKANDERLFSSKATMRLNGHGDDEADRNGLD